MNAPIDTLAFAQSFEDAGLDHDQARALAVAFGKTYEAGREDVITRDVLRAELAELKSEIKSDLAAIRVELVREIGTVGKDVSGRLWSTITIIAGVATAISATISAAVALLLKAGGL